MDSQPSQFPLAEIKQHIQAARSILIVLPVQHTVDNVAAGLALFLALEQYGSNENEPAKSLQIVSPSDITVAYQRLYAVGSIQNRLGSKNLVISLNIPHESVEKVISNNDNGKFNLIIEARTGTRKLHAEDVEFGYQGVDADLIITVGLSTAEQAGSLLNQEKNLFADRNVITIANLTNAVAFGTINYLDTSASGVAEMVSRLLRFLKVSIDPDVATNLLAGIEAATNNFMIKTTADTFAAISWCMRAGGKRNHLGQTLTPVSPFVPAPAYPAPAVPPFIQRPPEPLPQPPAALDPVPPSPFPPLPEENTSSIPQGAEKDKEDEKPQEDWFAPKIFRTKGSDGANKS